MLWKALALALAGMASAAHGQVVDVDGGKVSGTAVEGATVFRGIPYAAPPLQDLRWKPPQQPVSWTGVRVDDPDAPACLQNDQGWNRGDYLRSDEDCLTLDIRTPSLAGKRPVMVWIHGGGNRAGSARGSTQSRITDKGVVLVTIQYRLGIFGFLPHRGAAAEEGGHAGNYGLLDQIAALIWVKRNIARFGGDPDNVTIFGESAGSQDVSLLLASPQGKDLFHKAIMESGTAGFGLPFRPLEEGLAIGDQADKLLATDGSIEALRRRSVQSLLAADLQLHDPKLLDDSFLWLRATIDGAVLPRSPRALLADAPPRPVIIGSNRAEFGAPAGEMDWERELEAVFGDNAARARRFYTKSDLRLGHPELQFTTDWVFRCPAGRMADLLAGRGAPVWRYEFDLAENGGMTAHALEIPYVLGNATFRSGGITLSLQDYWVNFARTGDPNGALPTWPRYTEKRPIHILVDAAGVTTHQGLRQPICSLLEAI